MIKTMLNLTLVSATKTAFFAIVLAVASGVTEQLKAADLLFEKVSAGAAHTLAIMADGTLWAWGNNNSGALGDGTEVSKSSPVQIVSTTNWQSVAAGSSHTMAIKSDRTLWAWGNNSYGQLGDGTTATRYSPVQIGLATDWQSVAAGGFHTVAIKSNGTLWSWGHNNYGQLGDGTTVDKTSPVQIGGDTNWLSVGVGGYFSVALKSDGTLWAWGHNLYGQLGDGTTVNKSSPVQIGPASNWVSPAPGYAHCVAVRSDGTLWAWGYNSFGQVGDGTTVSKSSPVQIGSATNWLSVREPGYHTLAVRTDGTLWAWGLNDYGQLGDGTQVNKSTPIQLGSASNWKLVAAGDSHTVAIKTDGTLWTWGRNTSGQLGDGTTASKTSPSRLTVTVLPTITQQPNDVTNYSGTLATFFVTATGPQPLSYQWRRNGANLMNGENISGASTTNLIISNVQTNDASNYSVVVSSAYGSLTSQVAVLTVLSDLSFRQAAAGDRYSIAIKTDGTLWAWGLNTYGQLGDGTTSSRYSPVQVGLASNWQLVAAGYSHTVAIKTDGALWAWGYNYNGQLGDGTTVNKITPVQAGTATNWQSVAAGSSHSVALNTDGKLWAWGYNGFGQLGDGTTVSKTAPKQVGTATNWQSVAAGSLYTVAIKGDGTLWAWGYNYEGQLGVGTTVDRIIPTQVGTATNWQSVAAGSSHTVAIKTNGTLWAWGNNNYGQLGDGTKVSKTVPIQVGTATNWQSVAAGGIHTVAIKTDGTLWAWGSNQTIPVQMDLATNWQSVAADGHTLALTADGMLWAWGDNSYGQLGDGTASSKSSPNKLGVLVITQSPQALSKTVGLPASFSVTAGGTATIYYQWRKNGTNLINGGNVSGATSANLTIYNVQTNDAGIYSVLIGNPYGSVLSNGAELMVSPEPEITNQPTNRINSIGTLANFAVTAFGVQPLAFQWRKDGINLVNGGNVSGATTTSLTISNVQFTDAGTYSVVVTNAFGAVTSSAANLSITTVMSAKRKARSKLNVRSPFGFELDAAGNEYLTAWFDGDSDFGGVTLTSFGNTDDIFVSKSDSSGALTWVRKAGSWTGGGGSGWDGGRGVGVDAAGNVYVAGGFMGTATFGNTNVVGSAWPINYFLAKYDLNGNLIWIRTPGGALANYATGLAVDAVGNCYMIGRYFNWNSPGSLIVGTNTLPYLGGDDLFVVKYNSAGDCLWARSVNGSGNENGNEIAQDGQGNVYVAGSFQSTVTMSPTNLTSAGSSDAFLAKYDPNGALIWARRVGGTGPDLGLAVAADASGNAYVGGSFTGPITVGSSALENAGGADAWFAKYSPDGNVIWAQRAGGAGLDQPYGAVVDGDGNSCYFTGEFASTASFSARSVTSAGGSDVFVTKYDAAGINQWVERAGGTNSDSGGRIRIAPNGDCLVAGWFSGSVMMGSTLITAQGSSDFFVARVANTGFIAPPSAPTILLEPQGVFRTVGDAVEFKVTANGAPPLFYQWRKNGMNLSNLDNISGVTATNLTITNVQLADAGNYTVVVTNAYGSVTSSVAILSVSKPGEMITLGDYFPLPLNADWLYDGTDWDGAPAKTRYHVASVNSNITLYTGRSPVVAYTTNCVDVSSAYLDRTTLVPYDTWSDFMARGGRFGLFGDDDLPGESLRVDGGVIFPVQMAVGASFTNISDAYSFGTFAGTATNILQVIERTSLTVPAGYFPDVLHVRLSTQAAGAQVQDWWMARSVGRIKRQGISGGGSAHNFELISYSVPLPPTIIINDGSMGFVSGQFGFSLIGQLGQSVAVEVSTNLVNWLPVQTNTFGTGPFYFSDPGSANFQSRFYRLRAL